jgi:NhaP-type Na+/H+ or K+/H+ antiporter
MNTQRKSMLVGALLGAVLGAAGGYLFSRGLDMPREEESAQRLSLRSVPPGEMAKLGLSIMGVLRGIAEMGERL